jgi:hypothetical protein
MAASSPSVASSTGSASVLELDLHSPLRPSTTISSSAAAPGGLPPTMPSWTSMTPADRARMRTRSFDFRSPVLGPTSASPSAAGTRGQPGSPSLSPATKAARSAARSDFERDLAQTFGFEHAREGDDFAGHYVGFAGKNAGSAGKGAGPGPAAGQGASAIKHAVDGGLFSPDRVQTYTSSPSSKATATVDRSRVHKRTRTHTYTLTVATMQQWLPHAFVNESSEGGVPYVSSSAGNLLSSLTLACCPPCPALQATVGSVDRFHSPLCHYDRLARARAPLARLRPPALLAGDARRRPPGEPELVCRGRARTLAERRL